MTRRIGIDFGTANTVVAEWDDNLDAGVPLPLGAISMNREGREGVTQLVIPSLLGYRESDSGDLERHVGAEVLAFQGQGLSIFRNTKSRVSGRVIDAPSIVGSRRITGLQAASDFLTSVMEATLLAVDDPDVEFIVTAPVESFDRYSEWLVEVMDAVGAGRIRITDEATAAAVGYSARMRPGDLFLVVDFGAGTLDVSFVRVNDTDAKHGTSAVRVISKAGIDLGGSHIDTLIAEHVIRQMRVPLGNEDELASIRGQLVLSAEQAKVRLTRADEATISAVIPESGESLDYLMTRDEFEKLLEEKEVISRLQRAVNRVCDDAALRGFPASELKSVFLVGGTSLIPAVERAIRYRFDPSIVKSDKPLEAVAVGAAAQAGGVELFDHIQHDYAIRHVDDTTGQYEFSTLVKAGTEYPTEEPVATFSIKGIRDGQRQLGLAIFEMAHAVYREASSDLEIVFDADGAARTMSITPQRRLENSRVWLNESSPTFLEANPPARAGVERFRLDFRVDAQKRLTVSAFDVESRTWVLDRHPVVRLS